MYSDSRKCGGGGEVDARACIVMIEPEITVDKQGCPEFQVVLNSEELDWALKDCSMEIMGADLREVVQVDGNNSREESHVQEGFEQQLKKGVLIYSGNNPEQVTPNW